MKPKFLDGNRLTLLRSGGEYFPALERAIHLARYEIHIETYIYVDDASGRRITNALCQAARRGVTVRVMVDGFGAQDMPKALIAELHAAGVRRLVFRPQISPWTLQKQRLRRLHRKIAVIDGRVGFLGGINLIDDLNTPGHIPPRFDYAVQIEGPLLWSMREATVRLWKWIAWSNLRRSLDMHPSYDFDLSPKGRQRAALVIRDNVRHRADIENAYLEAIESAKDEIFIANAYFFPGRRFRHALTDAAQRGVRVVLLLQGRVEYMLLHYASRALYGTLLEAGVEIREYHKSFLHAKVAVIDGHWATVGSSNIDPFSLALAREANLVVEDHDFALELRRSLHEAMEEGAVVVARQHWFSQPIWKRVPIWIGYGLARFAMGVIGYGNRA
jgi:cardiolipin synthase